MKKPTEDTREAHELLSLYNFVKVSVRDRRKGRAEAIRPIKSIKLRLLKVKLVQCHQ